jgi:hypothetical protein
MPLRFPLAADFFLLESEHLSAPQVTLFSTKGEITMIREQKLPRVPIGMVALLVGFASSNVSHIASAHLISSGYNLLATPTSNATFIDLDIPGFLPPQRVYLKGLPLDPDGTLTGTPLYDTDIILRRLTDANIPVGGRGNISIRIEALSLVGVAPAVAYDGSQHEVRIESGVLLNSPSSPLFRNSAIPSSPDVQNGMAIYHDVADGGYFQAWIYTNAFVTVGNTVGFTASMVYDTQVAGVWSHSPVSLSLTGTPTAPVFHPTFFVGTFPIHLAVSPGTIASPLLPGMTFSIDYRGPSAGGLPGPFTGVPDGFSGVPMDEGSIYTPTPPGPPGPNAPSFGPLPPPGLEVSAVAGGPGVVPGGLHIVPGLYGAVELDALSYGKDFGSRIYFSVDEFAAGLLGAPAPPNVTSEGSRFGANREASADVFLYLGPKVPTPPPPPFAVPGNMDVIDGDGLFPFGGPGTGLVEPNPSTPVTLPNPGDNLDALDIDTTLAYLSGPIFLSLDAAFADPLEALGVPPNTGTAVGNGFVGGDVLVQPARSTPLALYASAFADLGLDRWTGW